MGRLAKKKIPNSKVINDKLQHIFKDAQKTKVKQQLESIVDVLEEALKELTIGIKNMDSSRLLNAKELLSNGLYGG